MQYTSISKVDFLNNGELGRLFAAQQRKKITWKRLVAARRRKREGRLYGDIVGVTLELCRAEDAHREAVGLEFQVRASIEEAANRQGLTTKRPKK